ncbi:hypothetical protein C8Q77DRAFT_1088877 [Trametes polyzona]|nr:hypothetical protein C8Q77DRAFT_1088877 [Trametes polyzona]
MQNNGHPNASPFMNAPTLPGAMSQASSDAEYAGDWNTGNLALPSRTTTPALSAGRSTPQFDVRMMTQEQLEQIWAFIQGQQAGSSSEASSTRSSPGLPASASISPVTVPASLSRPGTPEMSKRKRVPRPPNAFMLYRSHLLKTGKIPKSIEHRQQNISRVAGESWNMLADEDKKVWHAKAKEVLNEHMAKHPDYKFSPERKSSRRKSPQDPEVAAHQGENYIRFLREKYLGLAGPSPKPSRSRKPKSRRGVDADGPSPLSIPASLRSSPTYSPDSAHAMSAPPSLSSSPSIDMHSPPKFDLNVFQNHGYPPFADTRAPQETFDFSQMAAQGSSMDQDITPRPSTFGEVSMGTQPKFNFPQTLGFPACTTAESHLGLHNMVVPGSGMVPSGSSRPATPAEPQMSAFDGIWDSVMRDPYNQSGPSDIPMQGLQDDPASNPFATGELSGPIDFEHMHFPSLFPSSE